VRCGYRYSYRYELQIRVTDTVTDTVTATRYGYVYANGSHRIERLADTNNKPIEQLNYEPYD